MYWLFFLLLLLFSFIVVFSVWYLNLKESMWSARVFLLWLYDTVSRESWTWTKTHTHTQRQLNIFMDTFYTYTNKKSILFGFRYVVSVGMGKNPFFPWYTACFSFLVKVFHYYNIDKEYFMFGAQKENFLRMLMIQKKFNNNPNICNVFLVFLLIFVFYWCFLS